MDSDLWSKLPDTVIELVFARLPWSCILRLRSLNKFYQSFLLSDDFHSLIQNAAVSQSRCCLVGIDKLGTGLKSWLVEDAHCGTKVNLLGELPLPPGRLSNSIFHYDLAVASSGGLFSIFLRADRDHGDEVLVGNPVRNLWRNLHPPPLAVRLPSYLSSHMCMTVDPVSKEYKIDLVIHKTMTTYSSATDLWSADTECTLRTGKAPRLFIRPNAGSSLHDENVAFSIHDTETGMVNHIRFPDPGHGHSPCCFIFTAWEVNICRQSIDMAVEGLKDVQIVGKNWRSVELCTNATDLNHYEMLKIFTCDGGDQEGLHNMILLGGLRRRLNNKRASVLQQLLMVYNTATRKWLTLPSTVADAGDFFCINRSDRGCMFVPSLIATP